MYELKKNRGVTHVLETAAFKSSENRSSEEIERLGQMEGIVVDAMNSREVLTYRVDTLRTGLDIGVDLLAETIRRPLFLEEEFNAAKVSSSCILAKSLPYIPMLCTVKHLLDGLARGSTQVHLPCHPFDTCLKPLSINILLFTCRSLLSGAVRTCRNRLARTFKSSCMRQPTARTRPLAEASTHPPNSSDKSQNRKWKNSWKPPTPQIEWLFLLPAWIMPEWLS